MLDIGTYSGFSALAWYEGTKKTQAEIVTLELSKEMIAIARNVFEKNQVGDRIKMAEGLASERSGFGKPSSSVNANILSASLKLKANSTSFFLTLIRSTIICISKSSSRRSSSLLMVLSFVITVGYQGLILGCLSSTQLQKLMYCPQSSLAASLLARTSTLTSNPI